MSKEYKKFKEYYEDPIFKQKHLDYVNQKVLCKCGCFISRGNLSKHQLTKKHIKNIKINEKEYVNKFNYMINLTEEDLKKYIMDTINEIQLKYT